HELQGGSFKQGFISGVIGKLGGGIVHANVQTQTLQAGGMIIVSGIAAAASGANSRDAVMRSAVSVITVYLYNDIWNGMHGVAQMSKANTIINEANDVATEQTREFFKKEGVGLAIDAATIVVGGIDCIAGSKVGCGPALWAAGSFDSRWNGQPHIVAKGLHELNVPYAKQVTGVLGASLSIKGAGNFVQGSTAIDDVVDTSGIGIYLYESTNNP
ncbi:hypothetical protein, partial [Vibrio sp. M260112]|uniref:hypothetical protein n=1 Tax=Vibrio sp. M260112 TaxID=3020895 RepID=UPI002F420AB8